MIACVPLTICGRTNASSVQKTSAYTSSGDPGGYLPFDPNIPVDNGDNGGGDVIGSGDFAKGGMVWDNTLFD